MRSKISFFNRTIFRKNVTHFWPVWAVYSLFCMWSMPIYSYFNLRTYQSAGITASEQMYLKVVRATQGMGMSLNTWVLFLISIVSATAVFSYLYSGKSSNMIHALPVSREELFVTNYLSGLICLIVPQLLTFLLTVFVWFGSGVTHLEYLLQWLGIITGETFFAYSLGVLCAMLAGNIVAAPMYFLLCNFFYKGIVHIFNIVRTALIYGFSADKEITFGAGLAPMDYFQKNVGIFQEGIAPGLPEMRGMGCLKWYALAAAGLTALALFIYKKRKLECTGDMMVISWIKPVLRWFGAFLCAGLTGQIIQTTFFNGKIASGEAFPILLLCWLLGGGLAFLGIEMLIEKKFRVFRKKLLLQNALFFVLVVLVLGALKADIFHLERQVPKAEQVAELYIEGSYERYITSPKKIQESIELQEKIIDSKKEYQQYFKKYYGKEDCHSLTIYMVYEMKNGKSREWTYQLPLDEFYLEEEGSAVKMLMEQENNPEDYMAYYFTEQYSSIEIQQGSCIDWIDESGTIQSVDISTEDAKELVKAFQKDVESGNYQIYPYGRKERQKNTYVNTLTICYKPPKGAHILQYGTDLAKSLSDGTMEYSGVVLTTACENTIALLEEMGYIDETNRLVTEEEYEVGYTEMQVD